MSRVVVVVTLVDGIINLTGLMADAGVEVETDAALTVVAVVLMVAAGVAAGVAGVTLRIAAVAVGVGAGNIIRCLLAYGFTMTVGRGAEFSLFITQVSIDKNVSVG